MTRAHTHILRLMNSSDGLKHIPTLQVPRCNRFGNEHLVTVTECQQERFAVTGD